MIENLPLHIIITFGLTTIATLLLFIWTIRSSNAASVRDKATWVFCGLIAWLGLQAFLTLKNVYNSEMDSFPPKMMLMGIMPIMITIISLFITSGGRRFIDSLSLKKLTYISIVRIPVEIVLFWLFLFGVVPELMTFEGWNYDILAGLTAPIIVYYGFVKKKIGRNGLLLWNVVCLALLINIIVLALFSAASPFQKFAFDQPNIALLNFPTSWLPTFIVPIVIFSHLVSIRQLLYRRQ